MGKQTIIESVREWLAGICWHLFLWLNNLTENEYFRQIKEQELRTDESRPLEKLGYSERASDSDNQASGAVADIDKHQKLLDVIKDLEERDRLIMTMYYYERMTYKEIANVLDCETINIAKQLHSIIEKLYLATASL